LAVGLPARTVGAGVFTVGFWVGAFTVGFCVGLYVGFCATASTAKMSAASNKLFIICILK